MKFFSYTAFIPLFIILLSRTKNMGSADIFENRCTTSHLTDTISPIEKTTEEKGFKKKFQYDPEGKITHIETEEHFIKIEYDVRCNKQIRSTRVSKTKGDSVVYNFTYDSSCQLATGESSDGIKLGFKFDSKSRVISIIQASRKINITYSENGLPKKISLGNRDFVDNVYDSTGTIMRRKGYTWWHAPVGTYRVLKIMEDILTDTETLFNRLVRFSPGLKIGEIRVLFSRLAERPPMIDP